MEITCQRCSKSTGWTKPLQPVLWQHCNYETFRVTWRVIYILGYAARGKMGKKNWKILKEPLFTNNSRDCIDASKIHRWVNISLCYGSMPTASYSRCAKLCNWATINWQEVKWMAPFINHWSSSVWSWLRETVLEDYGKCLDCYYTFTDSAIILPHKKIHVLVIIFPGSAWSQMLR